MVAASRSLTPFGEILQAAVDATPGAVGAAFAASDGEMVDSVTTWPADDWAILTAHYGIVLSQLHAAFGTWHHGSPQLFIAQHGKLDIVVQAVDGGYYALIAVADPRPLAHAMVAIARASVLLKKEMA
jgi:hypothetical protein